MKNRLPKTDTPLRNRQTIWPWFVGISVILIIALPLLPDPYKDKEVLLAALGGLWAFAFFLHNGHKEDAKFMKELFAYFTGRYDQQNNDLQEIIRKPEPFSRKEELAFIDYFNLCAEEWVFRQAGYIYDPVWESWLNGMRQYGKDPRVAELWGRERGSDSHYGFELPT